MEAGAGVTLSKCSAVQCSAGVSVGRTVDIALLPPAGSEFVCFPIIERERIIAKRRPK
jgi:hypothetical protein